MSNLIEVFDHIALLRDEKTVVVAVSGGIDSLALTLLAEEWARNNNVKVIAITINHLLRASSTEESLYVNKLLNEFNIEHHIINWEGNKPISNIENLAREARYNLIFDFCRKNKIKTVLLGHHLQDQAENFLIRLFRGSGIEGLSSMKILSKRNGFNIIRPFLNIKKDDLKNYLIENDIKWIEDESNSNEKYLRNKIRNFLNTFEEKDLIIKRINSTIDIFKTSEEIIEKYMKELKGIVYFYNSEYKYYTINYNKFLNLNKELQYKILTNISKNVSGNVLNPRFAKLKILFDNIINFKKCTFYGCIFQKINDNEFVCYKEYNSINDKSKFLKKGELNKYLRFLKNNDYQKYKRIKDFRGYKREIIYTVPIIDNYKG